MCGCGRLQNKRFKFAWRNVGCSTCSCIKTNENVTKAMQRALLHVPLVWRLHCRTSYHMVGIQPPELEAYPEPGTYNCHVPMGSSRHHMPFSFSALGAALLPGGALRGCGHCSTCSVPYEPLHVRVSFLLLLLLQGIISAVVP